MNDKSLMVLALCMDFSKGTDGNKPLSVAEFHTLIESINEHNGTTKDAEKSVTKGQLSLFEADGAGDSTDLTDDFPFELLSEVDRHFLVVDLKLKETLADRILALRKRVVSISFEIERFVGTMRPVTVFDDSYPKCLKDRLRNMPHSKREPPFLFCSGDLSLFNQSYAAFVGSRVVDESDAEWTKWAVKRIRVEGRPDGIVSGGAEGVDDIAERVALAEGMPVIEYSKNMKRRLMDESIVSAVRSGRMLLLSEVNPFRPLSRRDALAHFMNRNKYIYASAEYAVVVRSAAGSRSGTWSGADEALRNNLCKILVRDAPYEGNSELKKRGCDSFNESYV